VSSRARQKSDKTRHEKDKTSASYVLIGVLKKAGTVLQRDAKEL
jgi:hypothetical protein